MEPTDHNFLRKVRALIAAGTISGGPGLTEVDVYHDDGCGIFAGGRCDCDPVVKVRRPLPDPLAN